MAKLREFKCKNCNGNNLAYQKYVKCTEPVTTHDDGHIEYGPAAINQDDYLAAEFSFICRDCGHFVEHCGHRFETERELLEYFNMDPEKKEQEQQEYDDYISAIAEEEEEEKYEEDNLAEILEKVAEN